MESKQNWADEALITAIAKKDHDAFRVLIERYQGKVLGSIYRYVGNRNIAEDLAQDIFIKVYKSAGRYQPKAKFSTWLFKLVVNHCINYQRHLKKDPFGKLKYIEEPLGDSDYITASVLENKDPETILSQKERITFLRKAINSLPERQKMAVILQRFEGLSYAEIGEIMGCSVKAVESLLQRAMVTLKESLTPYV
jgi:RNA polymerase sigma-70 factor (ECF subfamily)